MNHWVYCPGVWSALILGFHLWILVRNEVCRAVGYVQFSAHKLCFAFTLPEKSPLGVLVQWGPSDNGWTQRASFILGNFVIATQHLTTDGNPQCVFTGPLRSTALGNGLNVLIISSVWKFNSEWKISDLPIMQVKSKNWIMVKGGQYSIPYSVFSLLQSMAAMVFSLWEKPCLSFRVLLLLLFLFLVKYTWFCRQRNTSQLSWINLSAYQFIRWLFPEGKQSLKEWEMDHFFKLGKEGGMRGNRKKRTKIESRHGQSPDSQRAAGSVTWKNYLFSFFSFHFPFSLEFTPISSVFSQNSPTKSPFKVINGLHIAKFSSKFTVLLFFLIPQCIGVVDHALFLETRFFLGL